MCIRDSRAPAFAWRAMTTLAGCVHARPVPATAPAQGGWKGVRRKEGGSGRRLEGAGEPGWGLSLIHISEPTRPRLI
eukprot:604477-Rhodomonas_salina.1